MPRRITAEPTMNPTITQMFTITTESEVLDIGMKLDKDSTDIRTNTDIAVTDITMKSDKNSSDNEVTEEGDGTETTDSDTTITETAEEIILTFRITKTVYCKEKQ